MNYLIVGLFILALITTIAAYFAGKVCKKLQEENTQIKTELEKQKAAAEESGVSYSIISGIQKIKLSGAEKRAFAKWANRMPRRKLC